MHIGHHRCLYDVTIEEILGTSLGKILLLWCGKLVVCKIGGEHRVEWGGRGGGERQGERERDVVEGDKANN